MTVRGTVRAAESLARRQGKSCYLHQKPSRKAWFFYCLFKMGACEFEAGMCGNKRQGASADARASGSSAFTGIQVLTPELAKQVPYLHQK